MNTILRDLLTRHLSKNWRRPDTAIALPTAEYLWKLCDEWKFDSILDLGSGFSSWALRAWMKHAGSNATIVTTDLMSRWLEATRYEIAEEGLPAGEVLLHSDFEARQAEKLKKFDLIFFDLGSSHDRIQRMDTVISWLAPGGILILDDWHFDFYVPEATRMLEARGLKVRVIPETMDQFGRFVALAER